MNRQDFQKVTRMRLRESRCLLDAGLSEAAYYLAGLAIECAIKSCIAKATRRHDFPPKRQVIEKVYSHDLEQLVKAAGLEKDLNAECTSRPSFQGNWAVVKEWTNESRYDSKSVKKAEDLYKAVSSRTSGVLPWIRRHW